LYLSIELLSVSITFFVKIEKKIWRRESTDIFKRYILAWSLGRLRRRNDIIHKARYET
jgi:hypothetical protein